MDPRKLKNGDRIKTFRKLFFDENKVIKEKPGTGLTGTVAGIGARTGRYGEDTPVRIRLDVNGKQVSVSARDVFQRVPDSNYDITESRLAIPCEGFSRIPEFFTPIRSSPAASR